MVGSRSAATVSVERPSTLFNTFGVAKAGRCFASGSSSDNSPSSIKLMIAALVIAFVIEAMRNNESVCIGWLVCKIALPNGLQIADSTMPRHGRHGACDAACVDFALQVVSDVLQLLAGQTDLSWCQVAVSLCCCACVANAAAAEISSARIVVRIMQSALVTVHVARVSDS